MTAPGSAEAAAQGESPARVGLVVAVCVGTYLPFTLLGYGTDIDVGNVLRAGRGWLDDGVYRPSRPPGAAVHEVVTAWLDRVGGSVAVNLAAVVFAALALWGVHTLATVGRSRSADRVTLVVAANPWFWIASTSLADFTWALGLVLGGAALAVRRQRLVAGVLFGLAVGCRGSTALIVVAWLLAERVGDPSTRVRWSATLRTSAAALAAAVVCFVPSWLSADRSLDFLHNEFAFLGLGSHLGRWAVKNVAVIGMPAGIVLVVGWRHLVEGLGRWRTSTVARFAVVTLVLGEALFFRLPFKPSHLLPVVVSVALLAGVAGSRRWLSALVAAQLLGGLVTMTLAAPNVPDRATTGSWEVHLTDGPLLNDIRCRLDDRERGAWDADGSARAAVNFACQNEAWRPDHP